MVVIHKAGACIALAGVLLLGISAHAATPTQKCQEAKLKAQGKLQLCLKKNSAKVLGGKPDASAKCQTKFQAALSKAGQIGIAAGTVACRYVDNGDGTASDLNTGLVWEQKGHLDGTVNPSDPHDADNFYTWSSSGPSPDGTAFTIFLGALNNGTSSDGTTINGCFANHCDWRLPTIAELQTILLAPYPCGTNPCIDSVLGPTQSTYYWSTTKFVGDPDCAWAVDFSGGYVGDDGTSNNFVARAVRGGL